MRRRVQFAGLCCLLGLIAVQAAPSEWSCSLANPRNPYCPAKFRGDIRCNDEYCPPHAGCTDSSCNAVKGNIKADKIIALDAYVVKGDRCMLDMLSVPECCNLCKATEGCNAWSYCNKEGGCGAGCSQEAFGYSEQLLPKPRNDIDVKDLPDRLNPRHNCTASGAWPYGMCTLKFLAPKDLGSAPKAPGNQEGWISGIPKAGSPAWHRQAAKAVSTPARALPGAKQQPPTAGSKIAYEAQGVTIPSELENLRVDASSAAFAALQQQAAAGSQQQGVVAEQQQTVAVISHDSIQIVDVALETVIPEAARIEPLGMTMVDTPEGTLVTIDTSVLGQQQYINADKASALSGPEIDAARLRPRAGPGNGNSAAAAGSSSVALLLAAVLAMLAFLGL